MQWHRSEYLDLMTFAGAPERPMFVELFGPLVGLEGEWRDQGASPDELDLTAFDWDFVPVVACGGNTGVHGGEPSRVIEETAEYRIERDALGRILKLYKRAATIPHAIECPVASMDDWLRLKPLFEFHEDRTDDAEIEAAHKAQAEGALVVAHIPGGFDTPRRLMGEEATCLAFYTQPELIHDILEALRQTAVGVLERVADRMTIDQLSVHEDFAGKSGPMMGPKQIQTFLRPYYRAAWDVAKAGGARIFQQDSDGNVSAVLADLLDCGLTSIIPMEPAAGMDIVEVRRRFGTRLAMAGGIDKFVLGRGKDAIRRELEHKMQPLMREGGTVFGLDHRIPNGTPLEAYRFYVDCGREILGLPPRSPETRGWRRMAF
jgi:hypothetical protein